MSIEEREAERKPISIRWLILLVVFLSLGICATIAWPILRERRATQFIDRLGGKFSRTEQRKPDWLWERFGSEWDTVIALSLNKTTMDDASLDVVSALTNLKRLRLDRTKISDDGLVYLSGLTSMEVLWLDKTQIQGPGLVYLTGMSRLQTLRLSDTQTNDAGAQHLSQLTELTCLELRRTQVSDAGLEYFSGLSNLKVLDLQKTNVTDAGVTKLQQQLPDCKILWSREER